MLVKNKNQWDNYYKKNAMFVFEKRFRFNLYKPDMFKENAQKLLERLGPKMENDFSELFF